MDISLPPGMHFSTLEERREYYKKRFPAKRAFLWVKKFIPRPVFAINPGWYTKIATPRMLSLIKKGYRMIFLRNVETPQDLRRKLLKYLPEGVYYWRNVVSDDMLCHSCTLKFERRVPFCFSCPNFLGQELMFDIDADRFAGGGGEMKSFTPEALYRARDAAVEVYDILSEQFSKLIVVYSGRGFHIHVRDPDAFFLKEWERRKIAEELKYYGVDIPVTSGGVSLARLPYTLNGIVHRVVLPITRRELENFDPFYHSSSSKSSS